MEKLNRLYDYLRSLDSAAIAFSGGVDSAFLLAVAHEALGDRVLAVTLVSDSMPDQDREEAVRFCRDRNIRQVLLETDLLELEEFTHNPPNRCYYCKKDLFTRIRALAEERGISSVLDGSNADDAGDYRPGMQALAELGIRSPLLELDFTKEEIRAYSREKNLPTWDKPSLACLASRFVYGETITQSRLKMVGEAEQFLLHLGFRQTRVRIHDRMARIEVLPEEIARVASPEIRERITKKFTELGFLYVTLDLKGYVTGSMNRSILPEKERTENRTESGGETYESV